MKKSQLCFVNKADTKDKRNSSIKLLKKKIDKNNYLIINPVEIFFNGIKSKIKLNRKKHPPFKIFISFKFFFCHTFQ